jgi:hypothetical protein
MAPMCSWAISVSTGVLTKSWMMTMQTKRTVWSMGIWRNKQGTQASSGPLEVRQRTLKRHYAMPISGIADYLAPSHHRQGIMSAAIAALLKDWVIPRCNVHIIRTYAMLGNEGSVGVFRKNGSALSFFCPCHVDQSPLQIQTRENQEGLERVEGRDARLERVGMAIGRPVRIRGYSCVFDWLRRK